jgi:hypothetical protein
VRVGGDLSITTRHNVATTINIGNHDEVVLITNIFVKLFPADNLYVISSGHQKNIFHAT